MRNIIIIGGGLAGLINAYRLARQGLEVHLFERKQYPFHRVCGEYISNEVTPFLQNEGIYPEDFDPPVITSFRLSSIRGREALLPLDPGGFGISRFSFDHFLYNKCVEAGVTFIHETVSEWGFADDVFSVQTNSGNKFTARVLIGAFGKRSNLDKWMDRDFMKRRSPYIGVKYHIRYDHPVDEIALHNFRGGYCGISKVENGISNLCYLAHRDTLRGSGKIEVMEEQVVKENPHLAAIYRDAEFLFERPEVINEISFESKQPVENHVLMCGDSAGMITPLCGNGMAMAIHGAKICSDLVIRFMSGEINRQELEGSYRKAWLRQFRRRLWAGRKIQNLFGGILASGFAVSLAKNVRPVSGFLVNLTHGKPFS